ncbi:cytochrome P450 82C3 [Citrus sinensis]|nr:cytochrome P450 82C3 [Citrus sinensis]
MGLSCPSPLGAQLGFDWSNIHNHNGHESRFRSGESIRQATTGVDSPSSTLTRAISLFLNIDMTIPVMDGYWRERNERLMRKTAKEFDIVLQEWLDEHTMKRVSGQVKGDEDFMYVMLSLLDDNAKLLPDRDSDSVIKAMCLRYFTQTLTAFAGSNFSCRRTATWAIALLLNNRDVPNKSRNEPDIQVGTNKQVNESDSSRSRVWEELCKLQPERFLTTHNDVDVRGQNFELIPFGSGRRICSGISFTLQVMQLILASLLHGFDFETPSNEPVVMEEAKFFTYAKAAPLEVLLTPRLSASLYDY